jgi:hypothetical protein
LFSLVLGAASGGNQFGSNPLRFGTNSIDAFSVFDWALGQIGLNPSQSENDNMVKSGEFGILVPQKNH